MIDLSKITDLKELEQMEKDLHFFINKKIVAGLYVEEHGEEDANIELYTDRKLARELLNLVKVRIAKLSPRASKRDSARRPSGTTASPLAK